MYDLANSAFATTVMAAILQVYYSKVAGTILLSRVDVKRGIHRAREEDMNATILLSEN
jgi:MFS-type transporter involved in bile tolerance (Atg22 family)